MGVNALNLMRFFLLRMKYVLLLMSIFLIGCESAKVPALKKNIPKELIFSQRVYAMELVVYKINVDGVEYLVSTREGSTHITRHSK